MTTISETRPEGYWDEPVTDGSWQSGLFQPSALGTVENKVAELRELVTAAGAAGGADGDPPAAPPTVNDPPDQPSSPEEPVVPTPMNRNKPELPAYVIALVGLIIIGVLTFHGDAVPDILNLAVIGSLGIGGAVTTPNK